MNDTAIRLNFFRRILNSESVLRFFDDKLDENMPIYIWYCLWYQYDCATIHNTAEIEQRLWQFYRTQIIWRHSEPKWSPRSPNFIPIVFSLGLAKRLQTLTFFHRSLTCFSYFTFFFVYCLYFFLVLYVLQMWIQLPNIPVSGSHKLQW